MFEKEIDRLCPFGTEKKYKTQWDYIDYLRARDAKSGRARRISTAFLIEAEDERVRR